MIVYACQRHEYQKKLNIELWQMLGDINVKIIEILIECKSEFYSDLFFL